MPGRTTLSQPKLCSIMLPGHNEKNFITDSMQVFFAKPPGLCFNTSNFLNKEVGPGPETIRSGALCLTLE
jgi:hypothetical protein